MNCIQTIKEHAGQLFDKRGSVLSLWQEIAELVYPERADFTTCRNLGADMAANLLTSYPVIARRDMGNAFGAMLRPSAKEWFKIRTSRPEREDTSARQWLDGVTAMTKAAMYARDSLFARATKEADHDFAAFGNACISVEMNRARNGLLYRCWHLRDMAWVEDDEGQITTIYRRWKPTARDLCNLFPKTVHSKVRDKLEKHPFDEINVIHCIMPADHYEGMGGKKHRTPYVSVFIDMDHEHEMECSGSWTTHYVIPRWNTVSGSQYGCSPAVVAALPDARLLQDMTRVLLDAGEKAVNPPILAVKEAIRGDVALYPGGITAIDAEYDERLGEVLRPMMIEKGGLNFGLEILQDIRTQLAESFYLSKLNLPPTGGPDMTAYEVGQRVQEFIRNALPLFEPMEQDYNARVCEQTFELILKNSPEVALTVPKSIRGAEIEFQFESPLRDATEKAKIGQFMEAQQILATAIQLDPSVALMVDGKKATREVMLAAAPAAWLRDEATVDRMLAEQAAAQQQQQLLALMQQGADVAKTIKEATPTVGAVQ